ncbi:O-antigen polysaccharide polymerase Wzy family protein [Acinetobacter baumannii]|uniref:O-antigen polysaccharide polymerase Wzy family protein n=1 Tax=Acinetobacter baumannii TaxID=470 RepID=UPI0021BD72CF|nr:O-antigen polysaccharide polymerase Wzy family protein [Acinetobacter baumannii]
MSKVLYSNSLITSFIFIFFIFIFVCVDFLDFVITLSDYGWSVLFVTFIFIVYLFRFINKVNWVSLYSLFYFTSLIFVGGRFFAIFLGLKDISIFEIDFFTRRMLNEQEKTILMCYVFTIFSALEVGLYSSNILIKNTYNEKLFNIEFNKKLLFFILMLIIGLLALSLPEVIQNVIANGYLALHQGQAEGYSNGLLTKSINLLYATLGIFVVQKSNILKKTHLFIFFIFTCIYLMLGSRGTFVCNTLFFLWLYYDFGRKKVEFGKLFLYLLLIGLFLSTVFAYFSLREVDKSSLSMYDSVLMLLYDQGITLMVFNESLNVNNYPILPMIQNFIPGTVFIASLLGGVSPENISYPNYLAYNLDPVLFAKGYGLGWSVFSDLYVLSAGFLPLFGIIVFIFSFFINYTEKMLNRNLYWKAIVISTLPALLFLPRAGLYSYFPLYFYVFIILIIVKLKFK